MHTRPFGSTGERLSVVGLGAMPLSLEGRPSEADGIRVLHAALDAGITLLDTADVYCLDDDDLGHNERLIARALRAWTGPRDTIRVATKGGCRRPRGAWGMDGTPEHLVEACEASLRALGVEQLWLYQLHGPDDAVPLERSVEALAKLRDAGKVRHVGLSNVRLVELRAAQAIVPIVSVQNRMNPHDLSSARDGILAACDAEGLAFLPYSPVGGHRRTRRVAADPALAEVGARLGATPFEVALAWLLTLSHQMFPIPGASKRTSAESSARAADLALPTDDVRRLDGAFGFVRA